VTNLYICSRDANDKIIVSPDTHKRNLRQYLNQFRLISDNIDILDAQILNYTVLYTVSIEYDQNKRVVLQSVNTRLKTLLSTTNYQIGQPIVLGDIMGAIVNTAGVSGVISIQIESISGTIAGRTYASSTFNVASLLMNGVLSCPPGSIYELKYPDFDIIGSAL
jgi:hypothetical protein